MRICFAITIILVMFSAQVCQAQIPDCCANQEELQRILNDIMSKLPVPAEAETAATNFPVKVVYFIPNNRTPQTGAVDKLKAYIQLCQELYAMEMARNGYYKEGSATEGQTFEYEADAGGDPIVHIQYGNYDDAYYRGDDGLDQWGRVLNEVCAVYSPYRAVLLVVTECHKMNADASVSGGVALGAQWSATGGWGGVGLIGSNGIWFMDQAKFSNSTPYHGLILPEFDNIPMKQDVTWAWFEGTTIGQVASCCCGAAAHELGHAFGMPHCFVNDSNFAGDLMGNGLRGFRGNFGYFPGEWIRMLKAECDIIAPSRYFNPGEPLTDSTAPTQSVNVTVEEPTWATKKLHVKVNASDSGSGLYSSIAYISPPDSTVDSALFDAFGTVEYYINSSEIPGGLTARSYGLDLYANDNQGNRAWPNVWVQVPASMSTSFFYGDVWYTLSYGGWSASSNMRLDISLTARENGILYSEVEVQPVGTPFTGIHNYTGTGVTYNGSAVVDNVYMNLPSGSYHWQYRVRLGSSTRSCWVTMGTNDPNTADFNIDTTPPPAPIVTDAGQYTSSTTSLTGSWLASDPESEIKGYMVAIGTSPTDPGSGYVMDWKSTSGSSATLSSLNLTDGVRYYIYAKARNSTGLYGAVGVSDGITVKTDAPQTVNITQAKALDDGAYVKIENVIASSVDGEIEDVFYIQQLDRACGIRVDCTDAGILPEFDRGKHMTVTGLLTTVNGERALSMPELALGTGISTVRPLAMNGRMLGGGPCGQQGGIDGAYGLSNIGLLVRMFGSMTEHGTGEFTIDDGAGPVKVIVPDGVDVPTSGHMTVTGACSCVDTGGSLQRVIRIRDEDDIN